VTQLDRLLAWEQLSYCAAGLLWLNLTDVKVKQGCQALTSSEKDIRKVTEEVEFKVPQLLHVYLSQIGDITNKMRKEKKLESPPLPMSVLSFGIYCDE
jgi:hypothetical protein